MQHQEAQQFNVSNILTYPWFAETYVPSIYSVSLVVLSATDRSHQG